MAEIKFEMLQSIAVLSESPKGWRKEVGIVNWNDRGPKLDIREWSPDYERMSKGITLSREELLKLQDSLVGLDVDELGLV